MAVRGTYSTPAETKLWFDFLRRCPVKFSRQKPLGNYVADFYCASHRWVVEIDGDSHYTAAGKQHDTARDARLRRQGCRILRFTNEDVMQRFEGVCLEIAALIEEAKT